MSVPSNGTKWTALSLARLKSNSLSSHSEIRLEIMRGSKMRIICCDLPTRILNTSSIIVYLQRTNRNQISAIQDNKYLDKINLSDMHFDGSNFIWSFGKRNSNLFANSNLSVVFAEKMDQNRLPTVIAEAHFSPVSMSTIDFQKYKSVTDSGTMVSEESLEKYSLLSHLIFDFFQRSETSCIDYSEFVVGLRMIDKVVLEGKARQIFDVCSSSKGNLDASDLELALILHDELMNADKFASVNLFDLFLSFDIDNRHRLSFHQFIECMNAPGVVSNTASLDVGVLHFYFKRYSSPRNELDFESFCKLWSHHFANVRLELKRRGYLSRKLQRYSTKYLPWRRYLYEKNQLCKIAVSLRRDKSDLLRLRSTIEAHRRDIQDNLNSCRRSARETMRVQKRETLIKFNARNRIQTSFFQNSVGRNVDVAEHRQHNMVKILRDCEKEIGDKNDNIIQSRQEKDSMEETAIKISRMDRIDMHNQKLNSVPSDVYGDLQAKNRLLDIRILDLSCNNIMELPDLPFCFHLQSLRKLNMSNNSLNALPTGINAMKALQIMLLENNELISLPPTIGELNDLQVLSVKGNHLSNLPDEMYLLRNLRILDLSCNNLACIPDTIQHLQKLETMDLRSNQIDIISDAVSKLINLSSLNISSNFLVTLPICFGNLSNLEDLDLSYNRLKKLPKSISNLSNLQVANLEGNDLSELSGCTQGWNKLCSLNCMNCNLSQLSGNEFEVFQDVVYISFEMNKIKTLPHEIGIAKSLIHLKLAHNALVEVPAEIGALLLLETLDLSKNQLKSLPREFCLLRSLLWLDISYNKMTELPRNFGSLTKLSVLNASNNRFRMLPESFEELQNLVMMQISHNRLSDIPSKWCTQFTQLKSLEIDNNNIKYLPKEISQMTSLEVLSLKHNLLRSVPLELGSRKNLKGFRIEIFLEGNQFRDFPTKYMNMSDVNDLFFEWLYEEYLVYTPSVEEWEVKKDSYLGCSLGLDNFLEGVQWRCDRMGVDSMQKSREDRIRRLFHYCKSYGFPPSFVKLSYDEVLERKQITSMMQRKKHENIAKVQKESQLQKEKEDHLYFSDFEARQCAAINRNNRFKQDQYLAKQIEAEILLKVVNQNLREARKNEKKKDNDC